MPELQGRASIGAPLVRARLAEGWVPSAALRAVHIESRPKVVVLGGGFGGLAAVRALAGAPVDVTLVDRRGEHVFQPLLYRVALGDLEPSEVVAPLEVILREQRNAVLRVDEVRALDVAGRRLVFSSGALRYDWLILAAGAAPCYLGHERWRAIAPPLQTVEDALEIRTRLRGALAAATAERDPLRRAAWLTFAVVGGGPTGVELAGGLAELVSGLPGGHPGRAARVVVLERGDRLLPAYPEAVSRRARTLLEAGGVEVRTRTAMAGLDLEGVRLPGERLRARTVLWAAGVGGSPLGEATGAPIDGSGRLEVRADLSLPELPRLFGIGDVASIAEGAGRVPGTAAAAIQAGRHAAANVLRAIAGEDPLPFRFRSPGRLAAVGLGSFVGHLGAIELPCALAGIVARVTHARWLWPWRGAPQALRAPAPLCVRTA